MIPFKVFGIRITRIDKYIFSLVQRMLNRGHAPASDSGFHENERPAQSGDNPVSEREMPSGWFFSRSVLAHNQSVPGEDSVSQRLIILRVYFIQATAHDRDGGTASIQTPLMCGSVDSAGQAADDRYVMTAQFFRYSLRRFLSGIGSSPASDHGQYPGAFHAFRIPLAEKNSR